MLVAKQLNKLTLKRSLSTFDHFKYYIPLCTRPTIAITSNMMNNLKPLENDDEAVKNAKDKLYKELTPYIGHSIVHASNHFNQGLIVRYFVYTTVMYFCMPFPVILWFIGFNIFYHDYLFNSCYLHQRYLNLTQ